MSTPTMAQAISNRLRTVTRSMSTANMPADDDILLEPLHAAQAIHVGDFVNSPINRVRDIITDPENHGLEDDLHTPKPIFCEMMDLVHEVADKSKKQIVWPPVRSSHVSWQEKARWIKYEETVEEGQSRFSKPHITLISVQSILQIKNCLKKGSSLIDDDSTTFQEVAENIAEGWIKHNKIAPSMANNLKTLLMAPKQHLLYSKMRTLAEDDDDDSDSNVHPENTTYNTNLLKKIPRDSEAAVILAGEVRELSHTLACFVRLKNPTAFHPELPELPVPVRFVFVLLVPFNHYEDEYIAIGRTFGSMLVDEIFSQVCYRAKTIYDICDAVDEYMSKTTLVPPGKWNPAFRWEPQEDMPPVSRQIGEMAKINAVHESSDEEEEDKNKSHFSEMGLSRTGMPFGGLIEDIKNKKQWYISDFKDAFASHSFAKMIASTIFIFFANLTIIITFSGLMTHLLEGQIGASENLMAGCICGVSFALLAGQPMCILSATGPVLIFESIIYDVSKSYGWEFMPLRFWIGVWTAFFLILLVVTDASVLVGLITRFTEEAFATLIAIIFIIKALQGVYDMQKTSPITPDPDIALHDPCICYFQTNMTNARFDKIHSPKNLTDWDSTSDNFTKKECVLEGGFPRGLMCDFHPDVFLFSIILFVATFTIAMALRSLRVSNIFPSKVREFLGDFKVLIAIVVMTAVNYYIGLHEDFLHIPANFQTTSGRPWLVDPTNLSQWYLGLAAALPALFFTVLVSMDQHITTVIINRKDNNLKKGYGYHLDLLVIALLMVVCAALGLPFYVASTVISLMHVYSLRQLGQSRAPGETPQFLGILEQRVTAFVAHIFIGLSVFLTPVIRVIPLPVLLGVFLFMGVVTLISQQFWERLILLFTPIKRQPDVPYLRIVQIRRVHLYTFFQIMGLIVLFVIKFIKDVSMFFPIMLLFMMLIRKLLGFIFSEKELRALDDPLPSFREVWKTKKRKSRMKSIKLEDNSAPEEVTLVSSSLIEEETLNHIDEDQEENIKNGKRFFVG